jgi:hypothetical protein
MAVNKITWPQVGLVADPGRYLLKFGWLTITADDLAIWKQYPSAAFTLCRTGAATQAGDETEEEAGDEYRLGTFELRTNSNYSQSEK